MSGGLLSREDLAARWQAPEGTAAFRDRWVRRRCARIGLSPMEGFGRGRYARYRPSTVERMEAIAACEAR